MERQLATIEVVKALRPADDSDMLDVVTIINWECVVRRGTLNVGDKVVFFEVDSFLPIRKEFEFLRKSCYKTYSLPDGSTQEGFLLRTIRLRGNISQGLALPLATFFGTDRPIGTTVAATIGVIKYAPPLPTSMSGIARGPFPSFLHKTSAKLLQNVRYVPGNIRGVSTEKLDGTSVTFYNFEGRFGVCSRNWDLEDSYDSIYWSIARQYNIKETLEEGWAIQGEIFGLGVQNNPLKVPQQFAVFSVFNIINAEYYDVVNWCDMHNLPAVPIIDNLFVVGIKNAQDLQALADNLKSVINPKRLAEGYVLHYTGGLRLKVKSKEYELYHSKGG